MFESVCIFSIHFSFVSFARFMIWLLFSWANPRKTELTCEYPHCHNFLQNLFMMNAVLVFVLTHNKCYQRDDKRSYMLKNEYKKSRHKERRRERENKNATNSNDDFTIGKISTESQNIWWTHLYKSLNSDRKCVFML